MKTDEQLIGYVESLVTAIMASPVIADAYSAPLYRVEIPTKFMDKLERALRDRANPPRVEGFPEEEFDRWQPLATEDEKKAARWGFAQGTLAASQPRQGRLIVEMPLGKRMSVTAFVCCKCGFENEVSDMEIVKGAAPQPAPDEKCQRCEDWRKQGLSDKCPDCEAAPDERKDDEGVTVDEIQIGLRHEAWSERRKVIERLEKYGIAQSPTEPTRDERKAKQEAENIRVLQELTGSRNDQNPWLGIAAAVSLMKSELEQLRAQSPTQPTREQVAELVEAGLEVVRRWDALGIYKDDDFGEVQIAMEVFRTKLAPFAEKGGS